MHPLLAHVVFGALSLLTHGLELTSLTVLTASTWLAWLFVCRHPAGPTPLSVSLADGVVVAASLILLGGLLLGGAGAALGLVGAVCGQLLKR